MKIKGAVIFEKGQPFTITDLELDLPKASEVLVKVDSCGVCHTDDVAREQIIPVPLPAVFGHEGCGVIEAVGPGVSEFKAGDRVGFSFSYCGTCEACRTPGFTVARRTAGSTFPGRILTGQSACISEIRMCRHFSGKGRSRLTPSYIATTL